METALSFNIVRLFSSGLLEILAAVQNETAVTGTIVDAEVLGLHPKPREEVKKWDGE